MPEKPFFGQKGPKRPFWAKMPKFGDFGSFGAILGPSGTPGTGPGRGFYINPSRRGPAVPGGPGSRRHAAASRG